MLGKLDDAMKAFIAATMLNHECEKHGDSVACGQLDTQIDVSVRTFNEFKDAFKKCFLNVE